MDHSRLLSYKARVIKAQLSNAVTALLKRVPISLRAVMLRKAIAIADEPTRFRNGQISMFGSLANLSEAGFKPDGIVDVGANVGKWTSVAAEIFPDAKIHMIEAQPALAADLNAVSARLGERASFGITLLGAKPREAVPFYMLNTGSSVFEEVTNLKKEVVRLPMVRLDDVPEVAALPRPLLLKLDVQGYELEVLKGADATLADVEVVLMEVALLPYNKGAPLMPEVIAFMNARGFVPYDICGQHRRVSDRALFQIDMIFAKCDSTLRTHRRFSMFEPE
jgi:FkbM family methyltransferase